MWGLIPRAPLDPLLILLLGLVLDAVVGDLPVLFAAIPHPVAVLGRLIAFLDQRLNRETRDARTRAARGTFVAGLVTLLAALAGVLVLAVTRRLAAGWLIELFLVTVLLAQRSLYDHVRLVAQGLDHGGVRAGRIAVQHIVGRDPDTLDAHGIARAALESLFENFADGVVAPAFWYVIAGLPGLFVAKAVNTLDSMIAHRSPRYLAFGGAAATLDTAMNFIPARLAGLIIGMAAAFAPTAAPIAAFRIMFADARKHRSVNAGWPEGAAAGALNLALAGPRRYRQELVEDPWIGRGPSQATSADIRRGLFLFVAACLIHAMLVGGLVLARHAAGL
ncbi:MAG TPA: adenosylcobinamide-phosphate synthase CbiB [Alphaproteobacteria bacterium]|nr:adenosylcobinamide-phosphate synthase CbiB [Alphaproteobacteria bacterium]